MKSTKELARELGFLRKRLLTSPANGKAKRLKIKQIFDYLIVIDFESTCWCDTKMKPQEIIEFPAVLLNTSTGMVVAEFQQYVMPDECPILSKFCQELTGITQHQVDNGVPLRLCLKIFKDWLVKLSREKGIKFSPCQEDQVGLTTFVTWSDWDLSMCLKNECRRKQLWKPAELNQWIDLRITYKNFYGRKPNGLNGALQDLGISFHGRQHSGLDDSRNTASLAWRMIQDGCLMKITKTLSEIPKSSAPNKQMNNFTATKEKQITITPKAAQNKVPGDNNNNNNNNNIKDDIFKQPLPVMEDSSLDKFHNTVLVKTSHQNKPQSVPPSTQFREFAKDVSTIPAKSFINNLSSFSRAGSYTKSMDVTKTNPGFDKNNVGLGKINSSFGKTNVGLGKTNSSFGKTNVGLGKSNVGLSKSNVFSSTLVASTSTSNGFTGLKRSLCFSPKNKKFHVYVDSNNSKLDCNPAKVSENNKNIEKRTNNLLERSSNNPEIKTRTKTNYFCANSTIIKLNENRKSFETSLNFKDSHKNLNSTIKEITNTTVISNAFGTSLNKSSGNVTPNVNKDCSFSKSMKATPPLCKCGCRSTLRLCQNPGLNMGRYFYTCSSKTRSKIKSNKRVPVEPCNFFQWELPTSLHSSYRSSRFSSFSNRSLNMSSTTHNGKTANFSTGEISQTPKFTKQKIRPCQLVPYK